MKGIGQKNLDKAPTAELNRLLAVNMIEVGAVKDADLASRHLAVSVILHPNMQLHTR